MPTYDDAWRLGTTVDELLAVLNRDDHRPHKWEEIERVGNIYNRAFFCLSGMMHSATCHFGSDLQDGRIYQTFRLGVKWKNIEMECRLQW